MNRRSRSITSGGYLCRNSLFLTNKLILCICSLEPTLYIKKNKHKKYCISPSHTCNCCRTSHLTIDHCIQLDNIITTNNITYYTYIIHYKLSTKYVYSIYYTIYIHTLILLYTVKVSNKFYIVIKMHTYFFFIYLKLQRY